MEEEEGKKDIHSAPLIRRYIPPRKASAQHQPRKLDPATLYMHHPPTIMPNYGKRKELGVPKTSLSRVLLYDNITQQQMLDVKLAHIKIEKQRVERQMDLHKHSFRSRMTQKKQQQQHQAGNRFLPRILPPIKSNERDNSINGLHVSEPSFSLEDLRLPRKFKNGREILFRLKTKHGRSMLYHSYDENELFSKLFPLHTFYPTVKDDPRFNTLEESLVRLETCLQFAGFAELSPSFDKYIPKLPSNLFKIEESDGEDRDKTCNNKRTTNI